MRLAMTIAVMLAAGTAAQASSFVVLETPRALANRAESGSFASPSFVMPGRPAVAPSILFAQADQPRAAQRVPPPVERVSPSIIVLGEPAPAEEAIASVRTKPARPTRAARGRTEMPMVIRGGITGDAFVRAEPRQERSSQPQAEERPERTAGQRPATPPPPGAPPQRQRQEPPAPPPPSQPRPSPPTAIPL